MGELGVLEIEGMDPEKPSTFCDILAASNVSLCCISEHRWRGEGKVVFDKHIILFSGVSLAKVAEQGVGIVLDGNMQKAWANADQFCEFKGSRLMRIKLRLNNHIVNVISIYAPTYNTEAILKDKFYEQLNSMLGTIPSQEEIFILGDFNARVGRGSSQYTPGEYDNHLVVGPHGLSHTNSNGERLLALCEGSKAGLLRVMDTFFQHAHYGTWYHHSSRRWFHIDHFLAARRSARFVLDVAVKPGIGFDTDHRMVKAKLRFPPKAFRGKRLVPVTHVETRPPALNVFSFGNSDHADTFNTTMQDFLQDELTDSYDLWGYGVRRAAELAVGLTPTKVLPQWKIDHQDELSEISRRRQQAYDAWMLGGSTEVFRQERKAAKLAVRRVLNTWWATKASDIQREVNDRGPQHQFAGFRSLRSVLGTGKRPAPKLLDSTCTPLLTRTAHLNRWRSYFYTLMFPLLLPLIFWPPFLCDRLTPIFPSLLPLSSL